jgi:hypothetical protein
MEILSDFSSERLEWIAGLASEEKNNEIKFVHGKPHFYIKHKSFTFAA